MKYAKFLRAGLLALSVCAASAEPQTTPKTEDQCLAVLTSEAGRFEKTEACRMLARQGTTRSLPVLAGMLADDQLYHNALYAMQNMPFPQVDQLLTEALGKLKGKPLLGVIGTVAYRTSPGAVPALRTLLQGSDPEVAGAAALALGSIASDDAVAALNQAFPAKASLAVMPEAILRAAEQLAERGDTAQAVALYDRLAGLPGLSNPIKAAILRGKALALGDAGQALLKGSLQSRNFAAVQAAVRTALDLDTEQAAQTLAGALPAASDDANIIICQALGQLGFASSSDALVHLARQGSAETRTAALKALPGISGHRAAKALFGLLSDPEVGPLARDALAAMPREAVDRQVLDLMGSAESATVVQAVDLVRLRRIESAVPALLAKTGDSNEAVQVAAFSALGDLGSENHVQAMVDQTLTLTSSAALRAAESALSEICARAMRTRTGEVPASCLNPVLAALPKAEPGTKAALYRVLRTCGGARALHAVIQAVENGDAAAMSVLSDWNADALDELTKLARDGADARTRILAQRGCLQLIPSQEIPVREKLAALRSLLPLLKRAEEQRLALAALTQIPGKGSLKLAAAYLDDEALKEDAAMAVVTLAQRMKKQANDPAVQDALRQVTTSSETKATVQRAKSLLRG